MHTIHATCVAVADAGVLLRGGPGAGKSDLALRLIEDGALLVADDRVDLHMDGGRLVAAAPPALAGLLEVRGVGIVRTPFAPFAEVRLVVDLTPPQEVDRMPDILAARLLDAEVPRLGLAPFEASAPAKVRLAAALARDGLLGVAPDDPAGAVATAGRP